MVCMYSNVGCRAAALGWKHRRYRVAPHIGDAHCGVSQRKVALKSDAKHTL